MNNEALRVTKTLKPVELWIHPEGCVIGSIYLRARASEDVGEEGPEAVLNRAEPFLALKCEAPDEQRFYSKRSIIRVQYRGESPAGEGTPSALACRLYMMDGSIVGGVINEFLLPAHRRLFDYINHRSEAFIRLYLDGDQICLVNKAYVVRVCSEEGNARPDR